MQLRNSHPKEHLLMTQFYKSDEARGLSAPVLRARAFEYLLKNKKLICRGWRTDRRGERTCPKGDFDLPRDKPPFSEGS